MRSGIAAECDDHRDCDDGIACTLDRCVNGDPLGDDCNDAGCTPTLTGLVLSSGTLTPAFSSTVNGYSAGVLLGVQSVSLTLAAQQAYLKASHSEAQDKFGGSVAVDGDTVVGRCVRRGQQCVRHRWKGVGSTPRAAPIHTDVTYDLSRTINSRLESFFLGSLGLRCEVVGCVPP